MAIGAVLSGGGRLNVEPLIGGSFTRAILDALEPMLYQQNPLGIYLAALSQPFELVETWASDTDDAVGWSLLFDPDRCPAEALPWLGQIVGVHVDTSLASWDQRQQIKDLASWRRGTVPALQAAPLPYLTGSKKVIVRERYDGSGTDAPGFIEVITYASETTDATKAEAALRAQKAGGLVLTYVNAAGQDLQSVKDNYATLADVKAAYSTLAGIKADTPGA